MASRISRAFGPGRRSRITLGRMTRIRRSLRASILRKWLRCCRARKRSFGSRLRGTCGTTILPRCVFRDGHPREVLAPYATQIVQAPGAVVILYEYMHFFRVIPIDKPHPKDVELTFMGDAVGKWEGDTLVIDTIGLREWTLAASNQWHSDALHTIERLRFTDPVTVSYEIAIDDPKIFTRPWSQEFQMRLHPTWTLLEQVCEENNRCEGGKCSVSDVQK